MAMEINEKIVKALINLGIPSVEIVKVSITETEIRIKRQYGKNLFAIYVIDESGNVKFD